MSPRDAIGQSLLPVPFPRSYWGRPGLLLAGACPGSQDSARAGEKLQGLLMAGIRTVVNLMEPDETDWSGQPFTPYGERLTELAEQQGLTVNILRHQIPDHGIPSVPEMRAILDHIDNSLKDNAPVYVHCWGGKGRTGTVVSCHLARHGIAKGDQALNMITHLRRNAPKPHEPAPENERQCGFVREWEQQR